MADNDCAALLKHISLLRLDSTHADLTITCEGRYEFHAHVAIVCARAKRITEIMSSTFREAKTHIIRDGFFDAKTMARMLDWIYRANYDIEVVLPESVEQADTAPASDATITTNGADHDRQVRFEWTEPDDPQALTNTDRMIVHILVYEIADYYGIPGLQQAALDKFRTAAEESEMMFPLGFVEVVRAAYTLPARISATVRQAVVDVACERIQRLLDNDEDYLGGAEEYLETNFSTFQGDLIQALAKQLEEDAWHATATRLALENELNYVRAQLRASRLLANHHGQVDGVQGRESQVLAFSPTLTSLHSP
ncbi:hypothetical protein LTR56_016998 [Elasticomyces elasticus]|nr:hypothetical protein LTR56_016998 [Elasticomyces elasticus]KAK3636118.1 hypothetical protein LTR22_018876 [Elasticomyces elasticus]KAK4912113.1 hypothetical protein LTR49_019399 [Elasticomyces elasticus]KAK5753641.1 hypothetical protein LTS12_016278 [Elasticomyces elasticus]